MKKKTNTSAKQEQIQSQVKAELFGRLRHLPATYLGKIIAPEGGGMPLLLVKQDMAGLFIFFYFFNSVRSISNLVRNVFAT